MERIDDLNLNGKKIIQDTDSFLFGMDSVLLANMIKEKNKVILDLGTGSSVIPVIISQKTKGNIIIGIEVQDKMYELAKKNVLYNNLQDEIFVYKEDLKNINKIRENIFKLTNKEKVDIIVTNPPYKKIGTGTTNDVDEKYIARHEVLCTLEDIFKTASKLLKFKGKMYIVHKPERLVDLLEVARKYNLEAKKIRFMQPKKEMKPSIVLIEYVLGGGNECIVEPVLIEYNDDENYTDEILNIYKSKNNC